MYRDPNLFHAASSFIPERWLPNAVTDPASPYFGDRRGAVQTFAVGPRNCMGQHLAWAEMRLILGKVLYNFNFEALPGEQLKWEDLRTFLFVEKKPIQVKLKQRETIPGMRL